MATDGWLSDVRSNDISSNDMDLVCLEIFSSSALSGWIGMYLYYVHMHSIVVYVSDDKKFYKFS